MTKAVLAPSHALIAKHLPAASSPSLLDPYAGLNRYQKLEKLGEGNYGCVYKARDRKTKKLVALKKIKLDDDDDGVPSTALREVAILQDIVHEHIVQLQQVILEHGQLYLVFEFLDLDLRRYLDNIHARETNGNGASSSSSSSSSSAASKQPKGLPMPLVKSYVYQILLGVEHMHARRHLHRDLKPQNLLIDKKGRMQIADLGLARAISTPMPPVTHEVATLWYRPAEILLGSKPYSTPVDIWAIGCIMAEMISLQPSFPGDSEIDTIFKIFQCVGTPTEQSWPGVSKLPDFHGTFPKWAEPTDEKFCQYLHIVPEHGLDQDGIDLLRAMLCNDPARRISARQALQHQWFKKDSLHNPTPSAQRKLTAHQARVAKVATTQAAQRRAEKLKRAQQERAERHARRARGEYQDGDENESEMEEEHEEDEEQSEEEEEEEEEEDDDESMRDDDDSK